MESKKQLATATPTAIVDAGAEFFIINPTPSQLVSVALYDTTPDANTGWIPLDTREGLNRTSLGDGKLWLKADVKEAYITLAKDW